MHAFILNEVFVREVSRIKGVGNVGRFFFFFFPGFLAVLQPKKIVWGLDHCGWTRPLCHIDLMRSQAHNMWLCYSQLELEPALVDHFAVLFG